MAVTTSSIFPYIPYEMRSPMSIQFWLVWNPDGRSPSFRHPTRLSAESEAARLARLNPGATFYVLEPVCRVIKSDVIFTDMRTGQMQQEAPF